MLTLLPTVRAGLGYPPLARPRRTRSSALGSAFTCSRYRENRVFSRFPDNRTAHYRENPLSKLLGKGAKEYLQCAMEHRQCAMEHRQCAVEHRQCAMEHRQCAMEHRQCAMEHRQCEMEHRKVAMEHRQCEGDHRQGEMLH
jgi:hypothetical protein